MAVGGNKVLSHRSMGLGVTVGVCVSIFMSVLLVGILALMLLNETVSEDMTGIGCMFVIVLSSALGALISAVLVQKRWMIVCLINGIAYFAFLIMTNALLFEGEYRGVAVTFLLCFAGAAAMGLVGLKREGKVKHKIKKRRFGQFVQIE